MKDKCGFLWTEFSARYLINHEEFVFFYHNIKIEFVCEGNCYPIVLGFSDGRIEQYEFKTPQEALLKMRIEGKSIYEIWCDLE